MHGVAKWSSFGTFCIKHIQKNLIVACFGGFCVEVAAISVEEVAVLLLRLFIQEPVTSKLLKQIMRHVLGSTPSSAILYRICQVRKWGDSIAQKNFIWNLSEMIIEQWTSLNIVFSGTNWQIYCSYYQMLLSRSHILGHKYESSVRIKIWKCVEIFEC